MPKFICQRNFFDSNFKADGQKMDPPQPMKQWMVDEEYTGSDDTDRLEAEGLIAPEGKGKAKPAAPKKGKGKKGSKKHADELAEGEAMDTEGNEVGDTTPATGDAEADGEETVEDEEPAPAPKKKVPAKKKPAKGAKQKG